MCFMGIVYDNWSLRLTYLIVNPPKFIYVSAWLKTKMTYEGERCILAEHRNGKDTAFFDEFPGQVALVNTHGYGRWLKMLSERRC